ncbi:2-oxoacid:acceptor oxidoreductase family protein, partial [Candidatus Gracilibacteria bacterium]|nr:2-oxoacid:acceptor oxidoreductase family protein [Candidatus Gracilibacteria bacterium]
MNIILTGSSGSGLLSAGDIVIEGLQNSGYFIVAEREYPSLIKGGCSHSRIEVGVNPIHGISEFADIIVAFDRVGSKNALPHIRKGGLMIYGDEVH